MNVREIAEQAVREFRAGDKLLSACIEAAEQSLAQLLRQVRQECSELHSRISQAEQALVNQRA